MKQAVPAERYPLPPEDLRWRATGSGDADDFLLSGSAAVNFFDKEALGRHRKSFRDFSSILDFGCGCGRLIRSLRPLCDQWAAIHGTDIDSDEGAVRKKRQKLFLKIEILQSEAMAL